MCAAAVTQATAASTQATAASTLTKAAAIAHVKWQLHKQQQSRVR